MAVKLYFLHISRRTYSRIVDNFWKIQMDMLLNSILFLFFVLIFVLYGVEMY